MNKRLSVLMAVTIVLWAVIYFWPEPTPETDGQSGTTVWFASGQFAGATRVAVASSDFSYELVKVETGWVVLLEDVDEPFLADLAKVEALLTYLETSKPERRLGEKGEQDLAQYGLDNPQAVFTIEADQTWTISLGGENPSGSGLYGMSTIDRGQCLLFDTRIAEIAAREARYYYDLLVSNVAPEQVGRVRISWDNGGQGWEAARTDDDGYAFTWPEELVEHEASSAEMDLFIHELVTMEAVSFLARDTLSEHPDAVPFATAAIWVSDSDEPESEIEVYTNGSEETPYYARSTRHAQFFTLPADAAEKLIRPAFHLRERGVVDLDLSVVARQRLMQGQDGNELVVAKTDLGWQDERSGEDVAGMDMLLWRITDLKFEAEPAPALPAEAEQMLSWELFSLEDESVVGLAFFLDPGLPEDQCWIQVQGEDKFYPVSDQLLEDLQGQLLPPEADTIEESDAPAFPSDEVEAGDAVDSTPDGGVEHDTVQEP